MAALVALQNVNITTDLNFLEIVERGIYPLIFYLLREENREGVGYWENQRLARSGFHHFQTLVSKRCVPR